jgi:hypothetical protein
VREDKYRRASNYAMLVMATNSFGVQPEKNVAESWKPY